MRGLQLAANHISRQLARQNSSNHSTKTIKFKIYFYLSNLIPKNSHHREEIEVDEIWLGCACGEKRFVKPRMPVDKEIVYKREINSRDVYEFIKTKDSERDVSFIIETNYRHIRIKHVEVEEFFDFIDETLDAQGHHPSIRYLERITARIQARNQIEQENQQLKNINNEIKNENDELEAKINELREEYGDELRISVSGWKRKVYDENVDGAKRFYIRYGRGGAQTRYLTRNEIMNGIFTNQRDARIRYE